MSGDMWVILELHPDYEINRKGHIRDSKTKSLVHRTINRGYWRVRLDGKRYYVHQLVMETFGDIYEPSKRIRFKNGDKSDPNIENLEYRSRK